MNELQSKYENKLRSLKRGTTTTTTSSNNNDNINNVVIANQNNNNNSNSSSGNGDGIMKIRSNFKENDVVVDKHNSTHKIRNDDNNYDFKHDDITRIDKSFHDDEISRVTSLYMNKLNIIENELKFANDEIIKYKNEIQIYKSIINNNTSTNINNNNSNNSNIDELHNIVTENKLKFENEKKSLQDIYENRFEDMRRSHTNYIEQMTSLWKQERDKLLEQIQKEENRCQDLRLELMKVISTAASSTSNNSKENQKIMSIELNHFQVLYVSM